MSKVSNIFVSGVTTGPALLGYSVHLGTLALAPTFAKKLRIKKGKYLDIFLGESLMIDMRKALIAITYLS